LLGGDGEGNVVLVGLGEPRRRGRALVLMEGDNQGVMRAIQGKTEMPWEVEVVARNMQQVW